MENFWLRRHKDRNKKTDLNKAINEVLRKSFAKKLKQARQLKGKIWTP